jgi:hypothetical protein
MAITVNIQVSTIGTDAGPFTINDGFTNVATNVSRLSLLGGIQVSANDTATQITITSNGNCINAITIPIDSHPCEVTPPPPPPPPPPPTPTPPTPPPPPPPPPGGSIWTIRNGGCGFGTINDVGIDGYFMNTLEGPSTFPLSSTLYGYKTNPNGITYGSTNSIQLNVTTNLPGNGNCGYVFIYINNNPTPSYSQQFTSSPFITVPNVYVEVGDEIEVMVQCYIGCDIP